VESAGDLLGVREDAEGLLGVEREVAQCLGEGDDGAFVVEACPEVDVAVGVGLDLGSGRRSMA